MAKLADPEKYIVTKYVNDFPSKVMESGEYFDDALVLAQMHAEEHAERIMVPSHRYDAFSFKLTTNNGSDVIYRVD